MLLTQKQLIYTCPFHYYSPNIEACPQMLSFFVGCYIKKESYNIEKENKWEGTIYTLHHV